MVSLSNLSVSEVERLDSMALECMNIMEKASGKGFIELSATDKEYFALLRIITSSHCELHQRFYAPAEAKVS